MRKIIILFSVAVACQAQSPNAQENPPRLKTRDEVAAPLLRAEQKEPKTVWVVPAGTRLPIALRQPISTKGAKPGDLIYAQTTFPVVIGGDMVIPAGTWVQGVVDQVKRAGRIKGTAEMQFHLTTLIYANGYTLDIAAAIDQVPGSETTRMQEPGVVKRDSEKGKDLERVGTAASQAGQIGALAGVAARPSLRGFGVGGLSGVAAGTLIALLARGSDVRFDTGTAVEIALTQPMAIDPVRASRPASAAQPQQ